MATPGIHPSFNFRAFSAEERRIIETFSREWFITSGLDPLRLTSKSNYSAFLMKACSPFDQMFNLEREIIAVFSDYDELEARTIEAFDEGYKYLNAHRLDPICRVLISKDKNTVNRIGNILKNDPELPIIIPFSYDELLIKNQKSLVQDRFRKHFFSRDLFAFESPLKKDTYFFGRTNLITNVLARHRSNENSAIFGLRRSGKTSIAFGLERASKLNNLSFVSIDCQSPSVHKRRWFELLAYILQSAIDKYQLKQNLINLADYNELNASDAFHKDVAKIYFSLKKSPLIFAFDEIERISFDTGASDHWKLGDDFVLFWQAIRSSFQRHTNVFSYSLIGTNSKSIETSYIKSHDNPIFNAVPIEYIQGFDLEQTKEMVKKLGHYMGLDFDDLICVKLHDDFGGHPYLIRHVCSLINKNIGDTRPVKIAKNNYEIAKNDFNINYSTYTSQILDVLRNDFPDEYVMLDALARNDLLLFNNFESDPTLTSHLIGYGLIAKNCSGYYFRIESVKEHLKQINAQKKLSITQADIKQDIALRRNNIEQKLRSLIRAVLFFSKVPDQNQLLLKSLSGVSKKRFELEGLPKSLKSDAIILNFGDLSKIILDNWELFNESISLTNNEFIFYMDSIKKVRDQESHSGNIIENDYAQAKIAFDKFDEIFSNLPFGLN
jgi:hypothetical protein